MNRKRIGILVDKPVFGGGEMALSLVARHLTLAGYTVVFITWNPVWKEESVRESNFVDVLQYSPVGLVGKVKAIFELCASIRRNNLSCILCFALGLSEPGVIACLITRCKFITSERVDPSRLPVELIHRFLRLIVYYFSTGIVFQTEVVRCYFPKIISRKGNVIPNSIRPGISLGGASRVNSKRIVFIGRLSQEKGIFDLVEAFYRSNLSNYTLQIYGAGELEGQLKEYVASIDIEDRVFFNGYCNDVWSLVSDGDIFVLPSHHEGFPNALLEAMSLGLPCICSDFRSGSARILIDHMVSGYLYEPGNVDSLVIGVRLLAANIELSSQMGKNAAFSVLRFREEAISKKWIDYIDSCVEEVA